LPQKGKIFISVKNQDKRHAVMLAGRLVDLGFELVATKGTASVLRQNDIAVEEVHKIHEGRPHVLDLIKNGEVGMIINTTSGKLPRVDERRMRALAVSRGIPLVTTLQGAQACLQAIEALRKRELTVKTLQEYHQLKGW